MKTIPTKFPAALAITYKWLSEHDEKIAPVIIEEYKKFFSIYTGHKAQKRQEKRDHIEELRTLFKLCRKIDAPVNWIKYLPEPDLLMGEKALLMGCATSLRLLFECKRHYSHSYLELIDYIMDQARLAARNVEGFVLMLKVDAIAIDKPWIEIFQRYARIENTYNKYKVVKIGSQLLGVLTYSMPCSLLMDIVEVALKMNRCEEIKTILRSK